MYGFKKALKKERNADQIFKFLAKASDYIKHLKLDNGTLIMNSRRKTGFLGFLGCIKALEYLYLSLMKIRIPIYLPFYKLSQDHIEMFYL